MEAAFFRHLVIELAQAIPLRRIETIYEPAPGVWTLRLGAGPVGRYLFFRPHRSAGLLFLSGQSPENPAQPSAKAMWWRKRVKNRRITAVISDWQRLRAALVLSGSAQEYIVLDMRGDMAFTEELAADFGQLPEQYPNVRQIVDDPDIFRTIPQASPPLRRRLSNLPPEEGQQLLDRLNSGRPEAFFIHFTGQGEGKALCWKPEDVASERFDSALAAAARIGEKRVFSLVEHRREAAPRTEGRRKLKRAARTLERLKAETSRLEDMLAEKELGMVLQANLYRLEGAEGLRSVRLPGPRGEELDVPLDPTRTPTQNMQHYFHRASRAARGLERLGQRMAEVSKDLSQAAATEGASEEPAPERRTERSPVPARFRGMAVAVFDSSDGFLILRGKNAKANDQLVKRASPFDYWLHAAQAPGAHVLLRRDHPSVEVPERSLREAAALAALRSDLAGEAAADVLCVEARHVRKPKGAAAGAVEVDSSRTLRVALDPDLEKRLARG